MTREVYGTAHPSPGAGALVVAVEPGSDAEAHGLRCGDRLLAVDGQILRDVLDWQWLTEEPEFVVTLEREAERIQVDVERTAGRPLGVSFADVLFDGVHECDNACAFCFVGQLPTGLRPSLHVRDDDYRLSFLSGTFITLTNLEDDEVARIVEQRLSPLYVSLHAVDPDVRARLVCPTVEDRALERFAELMQAGIHVHVQIVLVPGVNDGAVLDETLSWLSGQAGVLTVGVVPLGYTAHQSRFEVSFEAPDDASRVLATLQRWSRRSGWLQAADEFYINAGVDVPAAEYYGEFPQYENGVGMVRSFLDDLADAVRGRHAVRAVTVVSGTLFAPVLVDALERNGLGDAVGVLPVPNRLLGGGVSVAGLLGGADIVQVVRHHDGDGPYLVPHVVVNSDGLLLDDTPADDLSARTGKDVRIVATLAASIVDSVCD